jgi:hypothetical protein
MSVKTALARNTHDLREWADRVARGDFTPDALADFMLLVATRIDAQAEMLAKGLDE